MLLTYAYEKGFELGREHGLLGGVKKLLSKDGLFDIRADADAMGLMMAFGAVIIGLYILTIIMGSFSQTIIGNVTDYYGNGTAMSFATSPGASGMTGSLNPRWNGTLADFDTSAGSSVNLAGVLPIAIVGIGILGVLLAAFSR